MEKKRNKEKKGERERKRKYTSLLRLKSSSIAYNVSKDERPTISRLKPRIILGTGSYLRQLRRDCTRQRTMAFLDVSDVRYEPLRLQKSLVDVGHDFRDVAAPEAGI